MAPGPDSGPAYNRYTTEHFLHPITSILPTAIPSAPTPCSRPHSRCRFFRLPLLFALLLVSLVLSSVSRAARLVDDFRPASAGAWTPVYGSPAPKPAPDGIAFPLPFGKPGFFFHRTVPDRAVWDKPIRLDLSQTVAFELTVFCARPDTVRAMGLYLKSGNGWYVADQPLRAAGLQTLVFHKSDFTTQDKPAGWNRIDGLRLSPWRGTGQAATDLVVRRLAALGDGALVVVAGTASCTDPAERPIAAKTANRVSRLLLEAGIEHRLATDDEIMASGLGTARLALLPYNPEPPARELTVLRAFLGRGGKLGVFYGTSAGLATSMHLRLGKYAKADRPDRWRAIAFPDAAARGLPERIGQKSPNLYTVAPVPPSSFVAARWLDARGVPQPEPAILFSPEGFWMTHILMPDNWTAKRDLLCHLCCRYAPELWIPAARRAQAEAGHVNDWLTLPSAIAGIRAAAARARDPGAVNALLAQAEALVPQIAAALTGGRPQDAWLLARRQRDLLLRADAATLPPRPGEIVGVWDHDGTGLVPGDWPATARLLAANGVNAIFPNVAWGGQALYPSKVLPASASLKLYGDSLAACLAAAAPYRQQVHAWFVLWKLDNAPADFTARMKKEGRLQTTASGATRPWLCPHHPANRKLMLDAIEEMARNYPALSGIHLDYIRLPDSLSCYSPTTRARFEAALGKKVPHWPADVQPKGALNARFRRWRSDDITTFVAEARQRLKTVAPRMKLSCAVYGVPAPDGGNIAQDWPSWLKRNLVDFLVPMNYTESPATAAAWLKAQTGLPGAAGRIWSGIGVTADESRLDAASTARQIALARQYGCPGYVLFSLNDTLARDILPPLRQGPLRP